MDYFKKSLEEHKKYKWKLEIKPKVPLDTKEDLSIFYTPWVAEPCKKIYENPNLAYDYTWKNNSVAVISDWSAVLWLWNIWWLAWLPVMEGKAILFKKFWWIDAVPTVLKTQDPDEIIKIIEAISPTFWWINLEDIAAPKCFYIEEKLKEKLDIPVFHDDQHWTAIVVLAGLINALKLVNKKINTIKVVINWAGAAWIAIAKLLHKYWIKNIITIDSKWIIYKWREKLNKYKEEIAEYNIENIKWNLKDALKWADVFIWVSKPNLLSAEDIKLMAEKPIVFALSNPIPEIMPDEAKKWWAFIVATWRSDFPNQVNNLLAFPWIFKWALEARLKQIEDKHKIAAAEALANYVWDKLSPDYILPSALDKNVANVISEAVKNV